MDIKGAAAVVTGGASGLGGATAARLAAAGAKVAIFDVNAELGEAHAKAIGGAFFKVDVTSEDDVANALEQAEGLHGKSRILVNSAQGFHEDRQHQPVRHLQRAVEIRRAATYGGG
jgi:NAD(P)-dependent dehydrogenase (short-subunit alcohol dehydrogenase family)